MKPAALRLGIPVSTWWLALAILTSLAGCAPTSIPSQAIFHPSGTKALRPSATKPEELRVRQKIYVPVYSNIQWSDPDMVTELSATASIRNTDEARPLVLLSVRYFDSLGNLIQEYLHQVMELDPMATVEFVVPRRDTRGGSGANFLVEWGSAEPIAEPVVEAIMLGQYGNAGISFTSPGRTIRIIGAEAQAATASAPE